jgi:hypothetical protein
MDIITSLILAVIFLIVGILVANLFQGFRQSQRDNSAHDGNESPEGNWVEEARLCREQSDGKLVVQIAGKVCRTPADLEPTSREQIEHLADELLAWLGKPVDAGHQQVVLDQSGPQPIPAQPATVSANSPGMSPPVRQQSNPEIKRPSLNPVSLFTRAITADIPKVNIGFKSITAQIDEILQNLVIDSPFATRGIHLVDEAAGGVRVEIGLDSYAGVDAVPDEAVRQLIRQAVAEWERQNARGIGTNKNQ